MCVKGRSARRISYGCRTSMGLVWWVLNSEGCGYRAALKRTLEEAGIPFTVVAEVNDLDLQMRLVREGVGEGLIPLRALPRRLAEVGLQAFRIAGVTFSLEARLLYRATGPIIPVVVPVVERTVSSLLMKTTPYPMREQAPRSRRRRANRSREPGLRS